MLKGTRRILHAFWQIEKTIFQNSFNKSQKKTIFLNNWTSANNKNALDKQTVYSDSYVARARCYVIVLHVTWVALYGVANLTSQKEDNIKNIIDGIILFWQLRPIKFVLTLMFFYLVLTCEACAYGKISNLFTW